MLEGRDEFHVNTGNSRYDNLFRVCSESCRRIHRGAGPLEEDDGGLDSDLQRRCSIVIQCSSMHACQVSLVDIKLECTIRYDAPQSHYVLLSSP